jgi:hypothetical protein
MLYPLSYGGSGPYEASWHPVGNRHHVGPRRAAAELDGNPRARKIVEKEQRKRNELVTLSVRSRAVTAPRPGTGAGQEVERAR